MRKLPVEVKEAMEEPERLIDSLKRVNVAAVTAIVGGEEQSTFLSINAKAGKLDLRDANPELIDLEYLGHDTRVPIDIK